MKKLIGLFLLVFLLLVLIAKFVPFPKFSNPSPFSATPSARTPSAGTSPANSTTAKVSRVVDGDTIELSTGEKVRYIGIDTPETVDRRKPVQCFGKEAARANTSLVAGKTVRLEKDVSDKDQYGRLLRYVFLPAQKPGQADLFVNDFLVREGFATAATFPPDVKYAELFLAAQKEAQAYNRGLWKSCPHSR